MTTQPASGRIFRYDGIADWYDGQGGDHAGRRATLLDLLGPGQGLSLDVGCGTGRDLDTIAATGRRPVGLELSADMLRIAGGRSRRLVRGDAERLPFGTATVTTVTSLWTSTDVDDFASAVREAARVLVPGGLFVFYGVHPCFNGPCVQSDEDGSRRVHPTYREARRHVSAPWWGVGGIRTRVGGMRHLPLAELFTVIVSAGLHITRVVEPGDEPVPHALAVCATS